MRTIIAIDPGASGGVAYKSEDATLDAAHAMWDTEGDIVDGLGALMWKTGPGEFKPVIYIEQVGGFIAGQKLPGSAMFNFGRNFGFLLGCSQALGFKVVLVRPQEWQKTLGLGTKGTSSKTEWKNKLKQKAQQLYPHLKVTLKTADALLILEHAKRVEGQTKKEEA